MSLRPSTYGHLMANLSIALPPAARFKARGLFRAHQEAAGGASPPRPETLRSAAGYGCVPFGQTKGGSPPASDRTRAA
jgi:hypothetical protein